MNIFRLRQWYIFFNFIFHEYSEEFKIKKSRKVLPIKVFMSLILDYYILSKFFTGGLGIITWNLSTTSKNGM